MNRRENHEAMGLMSGEAALLVYKEKLLPCSFFPMSRSALQNVIYFLYCSFLLEHRIKKISIAYIKMHLHK